MPTTSRRRSTYNYDVAEIKAMRTRTGDSGKGPGQSSSSAPRRRLSSSSHDNEDSREVQRRRRRRSSSAESVDHGRAADHRVGNTTTRANRSVRKERRFEDVVSDDASDEDQGGMTAILQKTSSSSREPKEPARRPKSRTRALRRLPKIHDARLDRVSRLAMERNLRVVLTDHAFPPITALHEEAGDDGFIFSAAGPSSPRPKQRGLPESKGKPPKQRQASQQQSSFDEEATAFRPVLDTSEPGPSRTRDGQRASSDSHQATRRASILKDGAPAYPHPSIADDDLYRHCSSTLPPDERLRHLASWTLERAMKSALGRAKDAKGKARENADTMDSAMRETLRDLGMGKVEGVLGGEDRVKSGKRKPHPRNEANKRIAAQLERTIAAMDKELGTWQRAKDEMSNFAEETKSIAAKSSDTQDDGEDQLLALLDSIGQEPQLDEGQEAQMQSVRRALGAEAPWLLQDKERLTSSLRNAIVVSAEDRYGTGAEEELARQAALARARHEGELEGAEESTPPPEDLLGTSLDPRWHDVEFRSDLLASKTHVLTQLSRMADRYTTAVSSRGAQAIGELVSGGSSASTGGSSAQGGASSADQHTDNLDRVLSGVRQLDDGMDAARRDDDDGAADEDEAGNVSDGDLLRAFVGLSRRR